MAWLCNRRGKLWYFAGVLFFLVIVFGVTAPDEALAFHVKGKGKTVNMVVAENVVVPDISDNPNGGRLSANSFFYGVGFNKVTQIQCVSENRVLETDCSNRKFFSSFLRGVNRFTNAGMAGSFYCRVEPRNLGGSAAKVFDGEFRDAKFDIQFNRLTMALGDARIGGNAGLTDRAIYEWPFQGCQSTFSGVGGTLSSDRRYVGILHTVAYQVQLPPEQSQLTGGDNYQEEREKRNRIADSPFEEVELAFALFLAAAVGFWGTILTLLIVDRGNG